MGQTHVLNGNEIAIDRATPKEKTALLPGRLRCACPAAWLRRRREWAASMQGTRDGLGCMRCMHHTEGLAPHTSHRAPASAPAA